MLKITRIQYARAVEKYKNHPIIRLVKKNYRNTNPVFHFENVSAKEIEKELKNLLSSKAAQDSDIPTKVIKDNINIFIPILLEEFSKSLALGKFPSSMKLANIRQRLTKMIGLIKATIDPSLFCQTYAKFLKNASITNCRCFLIRFFLNISEDLEKVLVSSTVL